MKKLEVGNLVVTAEGLARVLKITPAKVYVDVTDRRVGAKFPGPVLRGKVGRYFDRGDPVAVVASRQAFRRMAISRKYQVEQIEVLTGMMTDRFQNTTQRVAT